VIFSSYIAHDVCYVSGVARISIWGWYLDR